MADILEEIVAYKRIEIEQHKAAVKPSALYRIVEEIMDEGKPQPSMRASLLSSESGIIAEFKRRSPSKGWIKEDGEAEKIPLSYQQNGAAAISILTDEKYFGGRDSFIRTAREAGVTLPVLYKNFVIDDYQLFEARACGAPHCRRPLCHRMQGSPLPCP